MRVTIVAALTLVAAGAGVWAETTNLKANVTHQSMNGNYGGGAVNVNASNTVQVIDGVTTAFYHVNTNTNGACLAWASNSGSEPFLTLNNNATEGSISADIAGSASFDAGWTFSAGTVSVEATATSSNPQRSPTVLTGTIRSGNNLAQVIHVDQYLNVADGGSATVLFEGGPCASGALNNGSLSVTEQRVGIRTKS